MPDDRHSPRWVRAWVTVEASGTSTPASGVPRQAWSCPQASNQGPALALHGRPLELQLGLLTELCWKQIALNMGPPIQIPVTIWSLYTAPQELSTAVGTPLRQDTADPGTPTITYLQEGWRPPPSWVPCQVLKVITPSQTPRFPVGSLGFPEWWARGIHRPQNDISTFLRDPGFHPFVGLKGPQWTQHQPVILALTSSWLGKHVFTDPWAIV